MELLLLWRERNIFSNKGFEQCSVLGVQFVGIQAIPTLHLWELQSDDTQKKPSFGPPISVKSIN